MSAGQRAFAQNRYLGLGEVYDAFPERLSEVLLQKHAALYKELYNMLTDEEKEDLEAVPEVDLMESLDGDIKHREFLLKALKEDPYHSPEARQERYKDMPKHVIEESERTFQEKLTGLEYSIKAWQIQKEQLKDKQKDALLFA